MVTQKKHENILSQKYQFLLLHFIIIFCIMFAIFWLYRDLFEHNLFKENLLKFEILNTIILRARNERVHAHNIYNKKQSTLHEEFVKGYFGEIKMRVS